MIKFIIGKKGSGKTSQLIDKVNEAVKTDKGHLVFINDSQRHIFDLNYKVRLVDTQDFHVATYQTMYGLLCGIISLDYDISTIFIDSITKIVKCEDLKDAEVAIADIDKLCEKAGIELIVTASVAVEDAPEFIKKYV